MQQKGVAAMPRTFTIEVSGEDPQTGRFIARCQYWQGADEVGDRVPPEYGFGETEREAIDVAIRDMYDRLGVES